MATHTLAVSVELCSTAYVTGDVERHQTFEIETRGPIYKTSYDNLTIIVR